DGPIDYFRPELEPVLKPTYGVILYQEQVMQIAQELAGYSLGEADLLRRAMGKKKPEEMAKQRAVFEQGARDKGIDGELAIRIFDLVEKFAGYGFNKSHSAAYALVSYQTAWLKTHYPAQFMAAVMSSELQNTDKIVVFVEECRAMQLALKLPDVNEGQYMFTVNAGNDIIYGLGAIKGLGEGPVENLLRAREEGGPFRDLFDFCARTDPRKVNRRAIEALIRAGAFDSLGTSRWVLVAALEDALKTAEQSANNRDCGIADLFGEVIASPADHNTDPYVAFQGARPWTGKERLGGEKDTLGLYVTGHPIDEYEQEVRKFAPTRIADLRADKQGGQVVAGLIVASRTMKTKRGDTMAILQLDDRSARIEVTVYADTFIEKRDQLAKDQIVIIEGSVAHDDYSGGLSMRAKGVRSLLEARQSFATELTIEVSQDMIDERFAERLAQTLTGAAGGTCPVSLWYRQPHNRARVRLGENWLVVPSDELLQELRDALGADSVTLCYN
ncbi:MAG TPA: DNA polymerase III subunit alpha, partial [Kineobactrum sp.]